MTRQREYDTTDRVLWRIKLIQWLQYLIYSYVLQSNGIIFM